MTVMEMTIRWFYMGLLATPIAGPKITFGKDGLRKEILKKAVCTSVYGK
jgi:hypothetical protein